MTDDTAVGQWLAIELEAICERNGQIDVVRDSRLPISGYALYLRVSNAHGEALAQWLCDDPERDSLYHLGQLLATSYAIELHDYTPQGLHRQLA
ncbi:hypothetical protein JFQ85_000566 [Aeromonas hydrophila]|nr:hypothetical protein [Aeromonas hydrophila]HAT1511216.1 hypothetical protein [Aeromonas hydrophila]HAT1519989.1 hypothetical protein [Aeromonas hydrophila]HAT1523626.1 hypothetical protein [Aeromonas hydrophila]